MSAKIPVVIDLATEVNDGSRKETTNNQVEGSLITKGNATYIRYIEQVDDADYVRNVIKLTGEDVTIIRNGAVSMNQRFREGQTTQGEYGTPFGTMRMETETKEVVYHWKPRHGRGRMSLCYRLALQGRDLGTVTLMLAIREVDGS